MIRKLWGKRLTIYITLFIVYRLLFIIYCLHFSVNRKRHRHIHIDIERDSRETSGGSHLCDLCFTVARNDCYLIELRVN